MVGPWTTQRNLWRRNSSMSNHYWTLVLDPVKSWSELRLFPENTLRVCLINPAPMLQACWFCCPALGKHVRHFSPCLGQVIPQYPHLSCPVLQYITPSACHVVRRISMTRLATAQDAPCDIMLEWVVNLFRLPTLGNFNKQNPRIPLFKKRKTLIYLEISSV